jgi:hypothetical protein
MRAWQKLAVLVGLLGLLGMCVYVPRLKVERVFVVVPVRHPPGSRVVTVARTAELAEVREGPAGYTWVWSEPEALPWFGTELEHRIDWRLALQAACWGLLVFSVTGLMSSLKGPSGRSREAEKPAEPGAAPDRR